MMVRAGPAGRCQRQSRDRPGFAYTKIGVSNRAAATRWAVAHRVVDGVPGG